MAEKEEVKLLGYWASPFSRRIEMALKLKGIPYDYVEETLFEQKSPLLLALNPIHKKVPVLVHNGKTILESEIILEYIDETWKHNPILPQDPYDRSKARFLAKLVDEQILVAGFVQLAKADEKGREAVIEQTRELITYLEKELVGKDFFGGKSVGFLDLVAGSMIPFCVARGWEGMGLEVITEDKFPEYSRWVKNLEKVEFVKDCIPPREKHVEHMNYMGGRVRSS